MDVEFLAYSIKIKSNSDFKSSNMQMGNAGSMLYIVSRSNLSRREKSLPNSDFFYTSFFTRMINTYHSSLTQSPKQKLIINSKTHHNICM